MNQYHVYALVKHGESNPFYIGCTTNPKVRGWQHRRRFKDYAFSLNIVETFDTFYAATFAERAIIAEYRRQKVPLYNRNPDAWLGHKVERKNSDRAEPQIVCHSS